MLVYTGGTFDLFHAGHVRLLRRCHSFGRVVVALNTDAFVSAYKGRPPAVPYAFREEVLLACRYVDQVVPNLGGADSRPTIERVGPDIIVIGSDWLERDYLAQMGFDAAWLRERGIALCYVPYTAGISSSSLRAER